MLSGMNVARFNFSHQDHAAHKMRYDMVVRLREELNLPVATLLDTKGPEIRLGMIENDRVLLHKDDIFTLVTEPILGNCQRASISYQELPRDIHVGTTILIDDGLIEMKVEHFDDREIVCRVMNDGYIANNKGLNVPGIHLSMPYISEKDRSDILFGIEMGFDFIAASFTRSAEDIQAIRAILHDKGADQIRIIAKIENLEGIDNLDAIIHVSDGIMVARGDMGVEIPLEEVPILQKMMIKKVYGSGKQVITATQMLDSMMKNPRPTRAEATDVANAIYDGTSAIMLSGETAAGLYPIESLRTMDRIACRAEGDIDYVQRFESNGIMDAPNATNAISHATCTTAHDLGATAIITVTKSGKTARMISKYRPMSPIIGCSTDPQVCRQLNLSWGVTPLLVEEKNNTDDLFEHAVQVSEDAGLVANGDLVVITAGVPLGVPGTTNLMKVHIVGHILVQGVGVTQMSTVANLCVCCSEEEVAREFRDGDILVISQTSNAIISYMRRAAGIITEMDGLNSHAAIFGMALNIPVIVGAANATRILKAGTAVTMDAARGIVSSNMNT